MINPVARERTSYPTQKPEELIERIVRAASDKGSIVLDCFCGSGTTSAVAEKLGRRWIMADINKGAIQTTMKRMLKILRENSSTLLEEMRGGGNSLSNQQLRFY